MIAGMVNLAVEQLEIECDVFLFSVGNNTLQALDAGLHAIGVTLTKIAIAAKAQQTGDTVLHAHLRRFKHRVTDGLLDSHIQVPGRAASYISWQPSPRVPCASTRWQRNRWP